MRVVVQRVKNASVRICQTDCVKGKIGAGLLVLAAVENGDTEADALWLASKIAGLRVFEDSDGKMNLSVLDTKGEVLVVSQFTLFGNVRKGFRPSFNRSAHPDAAVPLYEFFVKTLSERLGREIPTGEFGAMMEVGLVNDGPITIIIDSRDKDV